MFAVVIWKPLNVASVWRSTIKCLVSEKTSLSESEEARGSVSPLKNHKNIVFLSNTGPDLLKNHKATKPAFNARPSLARQQKAI